MSIFVLIHDVAIRSCHLYVGMAFTQRVIEGVKENCIGVTTTYRVSSIGCLCVCGRRIQLYKICSCVSTKHAVQSVTVAMQGSVLGTGSAT